MNASNSWSIAWAMNAKARRQRKVRAFLLAGNYGPLYQAAYLLGGMQLYRLRKELVGTGKMTDREFHDAVLKENRIPIRDAAAPISPGRS